ISLGREAPQGARPVCLGCKVLVTKSLAASSPPDGWDTRLSSSRWATTVPRFGRAMTLRCEAFAVVVCLAGCGTNVVYGGGAPQTPAQPTPRPVEPVAVLPCPPARPFEEVGVLSGESWSVMPIQRRFAPLDDDPALVAKLREKAAEVGCDAVVAKDVHDHGPL